MLKSVSASSRTSVYVNRRTSSPGAGSAARLLVLKHLVAHTAPFEQDAGVQFQGEQGVFDVSDHGKTSVRKVDAVGLLRRLTAGLRRVVRPPRRP